MADLPPKKGARPRFAHYLFDRGLGPRDVAAKLGCSHEQVRRICLPYDDPAWRAPSGKLKQKIEVWTQGEITIDSWVHLAGKGRGRLAAYAGRDAEGGAA